MAPTPLIAVSSPYIRNAEPTIPGTPASETVNGPGLKENTTNDDGDAPAPGVTRTEPIAVAGSAPAVTSLNELRRGMLYGKLAAVVPFAVMVSAVAAAEAVPCPKN